MADITQRRLSKRSQQASALSKRVKQYHKFPAWSTSCIRRYVYAAFAYLHIGMLPKCGGFILIQPLCMQCSMLTSSNGKAVICCALALRFLNAFARASSRRIASYTGSVKSII